MLAEKGEEVGGVLVDNQWRIGVGDVDSKAVGNMVFTVVPLKRVQEQRYVLLGCVGKGDLNHIDHLLAVAVDESRLEGTRVGGQDGRDILLDLCPFRVFTALALGRRRSDSGHLERY